MRPSFKSTPLLHAAVRALRDLKLELQLEIAEAVQGDNIARASGFKAFGLVENSGERWCEAELHRLGGRYLTMASGNTEETETRYRSALRIARKQGAKSLELRVATSLSQLLCEQKKRQEAQDLLAPVYDWFTEGFDTPDLIEAKALLDELS